MTELSEKSKKILSTCDKRLQDFVIELNKRIHVNVSCGHRGEAEQNKMVAEGKSRNLNSVQKTLILQNGQNKQRVFRNAR